MKQFKVVLCGEKPLAKRCLCHLLSLPHIKVIAACTRRQGDVWWGSQVFRDECSKSHIPIIKRSQLVDYEYDLLLSVLYPFIIETTHIAQARKLAVNLHEAPLPRWRGCNGYSHAILARDLMYGTTLHELATELDQGRVIASCHFALDPHLTAKELYDRTTEKSYKLFTSSISSIINDDLSYAECLDENKSFLNARQSLEPLKKLDRELDPLEFYNRVRAFDFVPWEPAFWVHNGHKTYAFVDGSTERKPLAVPSSLRSEFRKVMSAGVSNELTIITDFIRPIAVCSSEFYRKHFPIFQRPTD